METFAYLTSSKKEILPKGGMDMDVEYFRALQFNYCRKKHTVFLKKMNFVFCPNISCNCVSHRLASVNGSASGKVKRSGETAGT